MRVVAAMPTVLAPEGVALRVAADVFGHEGGAMTEFAIEGFARGDRAE